MSLQVTGGKSGRSTGIKLIEPDETPNKDGTKLAPKGECPSRHGGPSIDSMPRSGGA